MQKEAAACTFAISFEIRCKRFTVSVLHDVLATYVWASSNSLSSKTEERMERVVGLAVEGDIAEIDVAESILRERLKTRQTK